MELERSVTISDQLEPTPTATAVCLLCFKQYIYLLLGHFYDEQTTQRLNLAVVSPVE